MTRTRTISRFISNKYVKLCSQARPVSNLNAGLGILLPSLDLALDLIH